MNLWIKLGIIFHSTLLIIVLILGGVYLVNMEKIIEFLLGY